MNITSMTMTMGMLGVPCMTIRESSNEMRTRSDIQSGCLVIFESRNHPISLRHTNIPSMSNFSAYRNNLKKFQHWPYSQVIIVHVQSQYNVFQLFLLNSFEMNIPTSSIKEITSIKKLLINCTRFISYFLSLFYCLIYVFCTIKNI